MLKRFIVDNEDAIRVPEEVMQAAAEAVFAACGMPDKDSNSCAKVLLANDLRGNESHGVSNMLRQYVKLFRNGSRNPKPTFKVVRETPGTAVMDADRALGLHVGPVAMQMAVDKAKSVGIGCVTVTNAGHLGGAGYHASLAALQGCVGQCCAGPGGNLMCPTFGAEPRFGTHPIAWAAPAGKEAPFLFDVATTQVAANKIRLAQRLGKKLASNWITDTKGNIVQEEVDPPDKFFMTPMGGTRESASHKGYGLACVIDILCNTMTGMGAGFLTGGDGLCFVAYNIEAFVDREVYNEWMDKFLEGLRTTPPVDGEERVLYPGLYAHQCTVQRKAEGIPYHPEVLHWFNTIAAELNDERLSSAVRALPAFETSEEQRVKWQNPVSGMLSFASMSHGSKSGGTDAKEDQDGAPAKKTKLA